MHVTEVFLIHLHKYGLNWIRRITPSWFVISLEEGNVIEEMCSWGVGGEELREGRRLIDGSRWLDSLIILSFSLSLSFSQYSLRVEECVYTHASNAVTL